MLAVIYKIVLPLLNYLIDSSQNHFISGRYIGESTWLMYDVMNFTQKINTTRKLMVIDFKKAFASITWSFIDNTLTFLVLVENYIKWIKMLNNEVTVKVIQSGYSSNSIQIGRGCRRATQFLLICILLVVRY